MVDGERYIDGGTNGDNIPVYPLTLEGISTVLVVHLSREEPAAAPQFPEIEVIDLFPSENLGGFFSGTVDFSPDGARRRINIGYQDGIRRLSTLVPQRSDTKYSPDNGPIFPVHSVSEPILDKQKTEERLQMEPIKFEQDAIRAQYEERLAQLTAIANDKRLTTKIKESTEVRKKQVTDAIRALGGKNK